MILELIVILTALVVILLFLGGAIQTFRRNWIVALLLIIFLTPLWTCWAIVEIFMGDPAQTTD